MSVPLSVNLTDWHLWGGRRLSVLTVPPRGGGVSAGRDANQITFTGEWAREAQLRFEFVMVIDRPWTWRARV